MLWVIERKQKKHILWFIQNKIGLFYANVVYQIKFIITTDAMNEQYIIFVIEAGIS